MSELGSLLDELKMVDNRFLSAGELYEEIGELCRGLDQLQVLVAEKTAALSERVVWWIWAIRRLLRF